MLLSTWLQFQNLLGSLRSGMAPTKFDIFRVSLKSDTSVPGLADVGVLHGDGDGPRAPPRCQGGPEKISNDYFYYAQQYLFYEIGSKMSPWPCRC